MEQEDEVQVKTEQNESKTPISPWLGRLRGKTSQDEKTIKTKGKEKIEN